MVGSAAARGGGERRPLRFRPVRFCPRSRPGSGRLALRLANGRLLCDPPPSCRLLRRAAGKRERSRGRAGPEKPAASVPLAAGVVCRCSYPTSPGGPCGCSAASLSCCSCRSLALPRRGGRAPGSRARGLSAGSHNAGRALTRLI